MNNSDKQRPGIGCLTIIIILIVFVILAMISGGTESEYEKAGNEFETWINEDPRTWTDTERQYFNDFWEWADKN